MALTSAPRVLVAFDGAPLTERDGRALAAVRVLQRLSLPTVCELVFSDPDGPLADAELPEVGASLEVRLEGVATALFVGDVTGVAYGFDPAHGREVRVRGYDLLHRARKRQSKRAHVRVTLEELARELLGGDGLDVAIEADGGPVWQLLLQHRQSDFELLRDVAARSGLHLTLNEGKVRFVALEGHGEPLALTLGETLVEARIDVNGAQAADSVTACGWDPLHVGHSEGDAAEARTGRAIGVDVDVTAVGRTDGHALFDVPAATPEEAAAVAQAELDRRDASRVTLWGVAAGDPRLRPGVRVTVDRLPHRLCGQFAVASATHTIDRSRGYQTEIDSAPPPASPAPAGAVATLGVVTRVDDPDEVGRVRATLPTYAGVETDWMRVMSPGAGDSKGLVALPAPGDHVLVLFAHGDAARGLVLGGLYQDDGPPDAGVRGNDVRRYTLRTRGGQRVVLDDGAGSLKLTNDDGSYLTLSPETVTLHAERDLVIEAPGRSLAIRAARVDFETV